MTQLKKEMKGRALARRNMEEIRKPLDDALGVSVTN